MRMELSKIRQELKYSVREMAEELVLHPSTYQGYESGRRAVPAYVVCLAKAARDRVNGFFKRYEPSGEFDAMLRKEYPFGIRSKL